MARILSLYYILIYTYVLDTKPLPATFQHGPGPFRYSSELWAKIPIRYLLSLVDARPNDFLPLRSTLFKLTAFCMPHMLPTMVEALEYHHGNVESKKRYAFILSFFGHFIYIKWCQLTLIQFKHILYTFSKLLSLWSIRV
jgi:hypothetical protein